jgi:selenocysteine-specific elongation factor
MYVVGTSGHIDHGKTSLIQALTGVDCDRLPEEKARQMTIDLGFAGMEVPGFGDVGFIDVPGHERYIRNMVAGAWGIDLGLLVVAADDGWMPQTEDHFRVLELLGVERIIAVINKIDLAGSDAADLAEGQVREKISGSPYRDADIVRVSAKTLAGIDSLKETIASNLRMLSRARDAGKPYMYIDRVFASKGRGTVVTGTLRNGTLHEGDLVRVLPGGHEARVKRIESRHHALAEGGPSQRTALNLSGVSAEALARGHILYRQGFFTLSGEIVARIRLLDRARELKNNSGIEALIGAAVVRGKIIFISGQKAGTGPFAVRIKFDAPWYCYPGQPIVLASPGGFSILGGGMVLLPGFDGRTHKTLVAASIGGFGSFTLDERIAFMLAVHRRIKRADLDGMLPESAADIGAAFAGLAGKGRAKIIGDYVMAGDEYDEMIQKIMDAVRGRVGLNLKEISDKAGTITEISRLIMSGLVAEGMVREKEGRYFIGTTTAGGGLSKGKQKVLDMALENGGAGLELDRVADDSVKRDARELVKMDLLVSLDGSILYHRDVYEGLKEKILSLFQTKEKLTVSDAKETAGLSRKYLIPLLNRIERDGLIKRLGDFRVKV